MNAQGDLRMYVVSVTVHCKPGTADAFAAAVLDNAANSRKEPGNLRFDVCRHEEDPNRFLLYEVYKTKDDFARPQATPHYAVFRDKVADMMAQPRQGARHSTVLFYGDDRV
jgi:autoinducer 2-degrading protein